MRVLRASAMGMCFGVRDALEVTRAIAEPGNVTVFGELVHNMAVARELADRGFHSLAETQRSIPATQQVLITAHGISNRQRRELERGGKTLIDTTCPLVQRAHDAAQRLQEEGYFVVVIGRENHVEVLGLTGDLERFAVVPDANAVACWGEAKIGVVCQTTTPPADARVILTKIRELNPDAEVRVIDTICRPTRERQLAMQELLPRVDAVVVVGGAHSNNTRQLAVMAQQRGVPVCHVQGAADLEEQWFYGMETIGLTAGTSTLEETITEVQFVLEGIEAGCL